MPTHAPPVATDATVTHLDAPADTKPAAVTAETSDQTISILTELTPARLGDQIVHRILNSWRLDRTPVTITDTHPGRTAITDPATNTTVYLHTHTTVAVPAH